MLEVKDLRVTYGQHPALNGVNLRVNPGEIVVILGANGAGKSTLLKAVSGICEGRVSGAVTLRGESILGRPANRIVEEGIALVPEGRGVFGDLSVAENLTLGAYAPRAREEEAGSMDRVLRLFPKLIERRAQAVNTMSGGEQQMVAIGRAMMSNPVLLTLDEPSLGLSPLLCKELFQSLRSVRAAGIGILMVEQNAKQSLAIADRAYLLENGRIVHEGRAEDLRNDPAVQAAYLGGAKGQTGGQAGGQAKGRPAAAAPSPPRPIAPAAAPRPSAGPSPAEIAAAALSGLMPPPPRPPAPAPVVAAPPPAPAPRPAPALAPLPASAPVRPATSPSRDPVDALLGGLSVQGLVAQASEASRARYGATTPGPAPAPRAIPASVAGPAMPNLSLAGADRLKSVLSEIEEAAARARGWRPDPHRK